LQYLSTGAVNDALRAKGVTDATAIAAVITRLKSVQNWVCKTCIAKLGVESKFSDAVLSGYSECWWVEVAQVY
jgi:hypothetical protein